MTLEDTNTLNPGDHAIVLGRTPNDPDREAVISYQHGDLPCYALQYTDTGERSSAWRIDIKTPEEAACRYAGELVVSSHRESEGHITRQAFEAEQVALWANVEKNGLLTEVLHHLGQPSPEPWAWGWNPPQERN